MFTCVPEVSEASESVRFVAALMRRLLTRGTHPPVDPSVEDELLALAGLGRAARPNAHPGDLSRTLDTHVVPSPNTLRAAVRHREAFSPDRSLRFHDGSALIAEDAAREFWDIEIPSRMGALGHWWHPRVSLTPLLRHGATDAADADFFYATPGKLVGVTVSGGQVKQDGKREATLRRALEDVGIDHVRSAPEHLESLLERHAFPTADSTHGASSPTLDRTAEVLVWGPVVAQRIALAITEALDLGWLSDDHWHLIIDEPVGIAPAAAKAAIEQLVALAAVWQSPLTPLRISVTTGGATVAWILSGDGVLEPSPIVPSANAGADVSVTVWIHIDPYRGPYHELPREVERCIVVRSTFLPMQVVDARPFGARHSRVESAGDIPSWALLRLLQGLFAKRDFQPEGPHPRGQETAIRRLLAGEDTVVLLPTGAGKSLIYQMAGLLLPGLTLVVDPIVALIEDQVDGLASQGIDRALGISSADRLDGTAEEKLGRVAEGEALFVFVAPERLQQRRFRAALRSLSVSTPISLVVADEAHCVSEWGHDFRPAYLDLGRVLRHVATDEEGTTPPLLALTGTASRAVLKDMLIELGVDRSNPDVVIQPQDFDRPELRYVVVPATKRDVSERVLGTLKGMPSRFRHADVPRTVADFLRPRGDRTASGIVFCQTKNRDFGVERMRQHLARSLASEPAFYHGVKSTEGSLRGTIRENARRFKNNQTSLLIATKAYGMGIDKANVRFIVHVGIPASIENYYQEAGRAGRDRSESICAIVHFPEARETLEYFHTKSYAGEDAEVQKLREVVGLLPALGASEDATLPFGADDEERGRRERSIHRLKLLGAVRDYTLDWSRGRFELQLRPCTPSDVDAGLREFVRRNQPGRVAEFDRRMSQDAPEQLAARLIDRGKMMIEYVYETIVASRRRAVDEMARLADASASSASSSDAVMRDGILRYLDLGVVASALQRLLEADTFSFDEWRGLLDGMDALDDAREWRGATTRLLESDPDNPGLLLGRALSEAAGAGSSGTAVFVANLEAALSSAFSAYSVPKHELAALLIWLREWLLRRHAALCSTLYGVAERAIPASADIVLAPLEAQVQRDASASHAELAVLLERRLSRLHRSLTDSHQHLIMTT